ncbi:MAG: hypothetical protein DCF14_24530 [Phormidesmis priestleyi]|nr:MAG: hypothetical protein DCF14_24530 [Phormidesmis priestleyi]
MFIHVSNLSLILRDSSTVEIFASSAVCHNFPTAF